MTFVPSANILISMEAQCSQCAFPIHVAAVGEAVKCPACDFRGIAGRNDSSAWVIGLLGALAVICVAVAKEGKKQ